MRLGVGYAQPVWAGGEGWQSGELIVGGRMDYHRVSLSKQVFLVDDVDDFGDTLTDGYDANEETSNGVSLSLGAIWRADLYQLGLTLHNINEPEFDYGAVGTNCGGLTGALQNNCFVAQNFASSGRILTNEVHTMHAYMTAEASFWATDNWMIGGSLDLGEHEDFVGDDQQWLSVTALYQSSHWAAPGFRLGFRQNQVGSELSSVSFGATLFRNASFDLEVGLENTEYDGESAPRNFAFNFGFEEHF